LPSPLLWRRGLLTVYFCGLCLLKVHMESSSFPSSLLWCAQNIPPFFFFFFAGWESVCPGPYAGLPQEWLWEYRMLLICSPVGLHHLKQTLNQCLVARLPSWFLSVMWHGEALCRLEVQSVRVLLILGGFSCQVWIQHLRKIFDLQISSSL
jgi:hypothetical protein